MSESNAQDYAWGVSVGSMHWSTFGMPHDRGLQTVTKHRSQNHTPASVLLSRFSGEPLRLDYYSPPHPRGSAELWPPEAGIGSDCGSGRFPLAAAWTGRIEGRVWSWKVDAESRELHSLDAIAYAVSQLAKRHARGSSSAIVIPNDFKQREQQKLIDACLASGVDAALLWLPVAAAMAWIDDHQDLLPDPKSRLNESLVLPVVHADWGRVSCCTLHIVPHHDQHGTRWLPARRRPVVSDCNIHGFGWNDAAGCDEANVESAWKQCFIENNRPLPKSATGSDQNLLDHVAGWTVDQLSRWQVDGALAKHLSAIDSPISAIFVGDFAEVISAGPDVQHQCKRMTESGSKSVPVIATGIAGEDLLAKGASIFARDRAENRTSYLDTLPDLELFVDRNHQYEWRKLLGDGHKFIDGGKQWELPEPIKDLALRRGATSIKLVVAHDEYPGVRELQVTLDRPAEQRLAATLNVSATPAQGNAKLRLVTDAHASIPSRSILANWDRMEPVRDHEGNSVDKVAFLKMQPRAYPELFPRRWSHAKWRAAIPTAQEIIRRVKDEPVDSIMKDDWSITHLKDRLLAKDQSQTPYDATAIGSDFKAPFDQATLDALGDLLLRLWRASKQLQSPSVSTLVRALGYISVEDKDFDDWLGKNLSNRFRDRQAVLHTSGLAMRSPTNITKLFNFVFLSNGRTVSPGANELKAISQVLRYRTDATQSIDSQKCELVIQTCLGIFERGMEPGGGGYPFRWASLIIVYMLRRRMFDLDFLDPEQALAVKAKELFRTAIQRHQKRRLRPMGGSVDLPAALQQMINYIDRKGSGDILMASE